MRRVKTTKIGSLMGNEQLIDEHLNFRDGFYIEAGANNGIAYSNTIILEAKGWKGLLVEPNKQRWSECKTNRSQEKNICEHCALVSFDYKEPTMPGNFAEENIDLSLMAQATIIPDYYDEQQRTAAEQKISSRPIVRVPAHTLQFLVDKHNIKRIDFLSLDVEGYEYETMNGLNFEQNPPRFIRIETTHLVYRQIKMTDYLAAKGYHFLGMPNTSDCFYKLT